MSCIGSASFRPTLNKSATRDAEHATYPYELEAQGLVVLGPEVVASRDGESIMWRGVLYKRAESIGQTDPLEIT